MSEPEKRCACGGTPYKHPPHIEAERVAMWKRGVETGRHRADEDMPAWCAACIWRLLNEALNGSNDVNAVGGSA